MRAPLLPFLRVPSRSQQWRRKQEAAGTGMDRAMEMGEHIEKVHKIAITANNDVAYHSRRIEG